MNRQAINHRPTRRRSATRSPAKATRHAFWSLAVSAAAGLLSACTLVPGAPPAQLYVIEAGPPGVHHDCALAFSVREVRVAGHLDRGEIVIDKVGSRIDTSRDAMWASPPARELPAALARALAERLRGSQIVPHPWRFGEAPQLALNVDVDRLEPEGGRLVAAIRWNASEPRGEAPAVARGRFEATVPVASQDAASTAAAVTTVLGRFADDLATQLVQHPGFGALCTASK